LGNAFLSTISQVSAILHVVRAFETCDGDFVEHVSGALNPLDDIQLINDELALKDMQNLEKAEQRMKKRTDEATKRDFALKVLNAVGQGSEQFDKFRSALNAAERDLLDSFSLLSMKPQLIIVNVSDEAIANGGNELSRQVLSKYPQAIMLCGKLEADMNDMSLSDADAAAMLHDFGVKVNAYDNVINSAMKLLNLQTFYTVGPQEVFWFLVFVCHCLASCIESNRFIRSSQARSWLFRRGDTAPKCGSLIHTDFEKKFVRVEVIAYDDFVQCGGEAAAKAAAKLRIEGPPNSYSESARVLRFCFFSFDFALVIGPKYVMNDGDVCLFRIG
jgi:ribosome-binding ATPase YchF (GTP1/OBG family)